MAKLRYVGDGTFVRGIPTRDLEPADLKALPKGVMLAVLVKSGLYAEVKAPAKKKAAKPKPTAAPASVSPAASEKE